MAVCSLNAKFGDREINSKIDELQTVKEKFQ
jgi:hypothetical protein